VVFIVTAITRFSIDDSFFSSLKPFFSHEDRLSDHIGGGCGGGVA
jgi:hypothetical protein